MTLEKHVIDTVKEWQTKIGTDDAGVRLYYPKVSICGYLKLPVEEDSEKICQEAEAYFEKSVPELGHVTVTEKADRFCVFVSPEGCDYIQREIPVSEFLEGFLKVLKTQDMQQAAASGPVVKKELPKAIPQDISELMKHWKSILSEMGATSKVYLNKAVTSLGNSSDLILMFDDENAYEYLSENRAGCMDTLASLIEKRIGKKVEVTVKKNNSAVSAKEAVVDLTDMINFDIEEEN